MSASPITPSALTLDVLVPQRHLDSFWFAVRVRARSELRVSAVLECKGYESFAPTYRPACDDRTVRLESFQELRTRALPRLRFLSLLAL